MAKSGEATLLLKIKEVGGEILDRLVITLGDVKDILGFVVDAAWKSIEAFKEQEDAVRSLNQSMINAGVYSSELQNEYLDIASALQKVTIYGDEQIISAQSLLQAHLGNRKVTEELVKATLDLASAKGMDLASAADLIGKTISTENNALQRHGVVLDETAAKNDRLGAVIEAVEKKFRGQAEAAAQGLGSMARLKIAFGELLEVIGERIAPALTSMSIALTDIFHKYAEWAGQNSLAKKNVKELALECTNLRVKIQELKEQIELGDLEPMQEMKALAEIRSLEARLAQTKEMIAKQQQDEQTSLENALETQKQTKINKGQETWMAMQEQKIAQAEMDLSSTNATYEQEIQAQNALINKKLQNETDFNEKKKLMEQKYQNLEVLEHMKHIRAEAQREEQRQKEQIQNRQATLSTIATLQNSNNQTLAAIGKAAAITQIAIETPVAIARALAAFPPPFNFAAAGLVGAAMAAQAARIAGVQLAEGGVVKATQGGVPAIIGEGGRDEAVIPLDNGRVPGMGSSINITVYGGLLGDAATAREFALAVDKELLDLRRNNQSVAFDGIS